MAISTSSRPPSATTRRLCSTRADSVQQTASTTDADVRKQPWKRLHCGRGNPPTPVTGRPCLQLNNQATRSRLTKDTPDETRTEAGNHAQRHAPTGALMHSHLDRRPVPPRCSVICCAATLGPRSYAAAMVWMTLFCARSAHAPVLRRQALRKHEEGLGAQPQLQKCSHTKGGSANDAREGGQQPPSSRKSRCRKSK